jgi:hypothetical protein
MAQITYVILLIVALCLGAYRHGKPVTEVTYNFWTSLIAVVLQVLIMLWGGFFDVWLK